MVAILFLSKLMVCAAYASEQSSLLASNLEAAISEIKKLPANLCNLPTVPTRCAARKPIRYTIENAKSDNGGVYEVRSLLFDGLQFRLEYLLENADGKTLSNPYASSPVIYMLNITHPRWIVTQELKVGASRAHIIKQFGIGKALGSGKNNCLHYTGGLDELTFCFKNDRVKSIMLERWGD